MVDTKLLRKEKLAERDALSHSQITLNTEKIVNYFFGLEEVVDAKTIFIYVSFRSEVVTTQLIEELLKRDKEICVPITHVKEKKMDAVHIEDMSKDLHPGYCGIPEPTPARIESSTMSADTIDIVVVPGSVFDERGGRFGYGGGYYDRFLENIPKALRIGFAFELQMIKMAPLQSHDQLLDVIITEKRVIWNKR